MTPIPALHVRLEGLTASFRHPLTISGVQMSTPMPAYSNVLGMISACSGRAIGPEETRVAFEFQCQSHDLELERTVRWMMDKKRRLKPQPKGPGISKRQVYWYPKLDLYLTNLNLESSFTDPIATPCFGRSQDIAWIVLVREIELRQVLRGALGPTLLPAPQPAVPGLTVRLPEWMQNAKMGYAREPGPFGTYQAMVPTSGLRFEVERGELYHPSDAYTDKDAVYLHRWMKE